MSEVLPSQPHTPYERPQWHLYPNTFNSSTYPDLVQGYDIGRFLYDNVLISVIVTYC
jgi:hypothetical protein